MTIIFHVPPLCIISKLSNMALKGNPYLVATLQLKDHSKKMKGNFKIILKN
jgi:hypothetical protein